MENALLISLIQNAAVLIAMSVIFDLVTHHHLITKNFLVKISVGVYIGCLGIVLLLLSYKTDLNLFVDTRPVLLSVTGLFFGFIPTIVAIIINLLFRIYEGGQSVWIGIVFIIVSGSFGLLVRHFWFKKLRALTRIEIFLFAFASHLLITIILVLWIKYFTFDFFIKIYLPSLIVFPIVTATLCLLLQHRFKRDQLSEQLLDNNCSLNLALNAAELIFFDKNIITQSIHWSDPNNPLLIDVIKKNEGVFENFQKYIHPDDIEELSEIVEKAIQSKESIQKDLRIIKSDHSIKWVHFVCQFFFNETGKPIRVIGVVKDITIEKQTEEQIKKLSRAVEQSPVSIVISDINGSVEYVNPKFSDITGYSLQDIIGQNLRILKSDFLSYNDYKNLWDTIISGNVWTGVFKNIKKDGSIYWESATISSIKNKKGDITHFIGIKEDITEKKQIYADLIVAKNKAEESNQLKSHFLANMSHEIRTPLNGILGFLDLIKDQTISESERNEYIDIVSKSGIRLLETINDIIEMSKIESGNFNLDFENIDLYSTIHDLICFFKPQTDEKGITLKFVNQTISSEALLQFTTDKNKLNGILTNIIKNAIKFTHQGSIEVFIEEKDNGVLISVKDTGIGIPNNKITSIFGRFIQADISNSRGYEGSGLGLSISKAYVELLTGKIWVESEVGSGSTFFLFLPFLHQQSQKEIPSVKSNITKTNIQESYTVLVAEDEEDNFQYLRILLQKLGVTILRAVNGLEAVRLVQETEKIDIVLMDIKMPEMSGIEAVKEIRTFNKKIPIIGQSAFFMDSNDNVINENGFTDYIMKPIKKEQLYQILKKYLD